MKRVFIYGLVDPETMQIRYIGKTVNPEQRLASHCHEKSACHRSHWIQSLKAKGLKPSIVCIEEIRGDWPWQESERFWIALATRSGWPITNNTSGGDGVPDLPKEARERISSAWIGRRHSAESKKLIGIASSLRKHSVETREKMSNAHSGRDITWGDKLSASLRKLSDDDVSEIFRRLSNGEKVVDISSEYMVHRTTISKIKKGTYYDKFRT